jgi:hypothetical protein
MGLPLAIDLMRAWMASRCVEEDSGVESEFSAAGRRRRRRWRRAGTEGGRKD